MDLLQKISQGEKYLSDLKAKISLLDSQINKKLAAGGYSSIEEALEEYKKLKLEVPEYEEKLDTFLKQVKTLLEG